MKEFQLKYGCNPNQKPARIYMQDGTELPIEILSGRPGYITLLDALNSWQLVSELKKATGIPSAASFKHVSPAGAATGTILPERLKKATFTDDIEGLDDSPLACAYARARGTDRMSSFGDFIALSDVCDLTTAKLIRREVSDGVIAPGYTEEALELLRQKKKGNYNVIKMNEDYVPAALEHRSVYGITFEQGRNDFPINRELLANVVTAKKDIPEEAARDLIVSLITLKYTQSNSVCFAYGGQAIGVGAGQQSRVHCTRLAGGKADTWFLRQSDEVLSLPFKEGISRPDRDNVIDGYINHNEDDVCADGIWQRYFSVRPEPFTKERQRKILDELSGVSVGSDAFFPFSDNIQRAAMSGAGYIAQPGGSVRDEDVIRECDQRGIAMVFTGMRLFHH